MSRRRSTPGGSRSRRKSTSITGLIISVLIVLLLTWRSHLLEQATSTPTVPITAAAATTAPAAGGVAASPGAGVVGVFVEPDDGRRPILDELAAAKRSVDLEVYLLSDNDVITALIDADHRGVRVRVILEQHPFGGAGRQPETFARLQDSGVEVHWAPAPYRFAHIKTFVVDGAVAIIMNLNLTKTSFTGNREFGAITTRPGEVAEAATVFEADWAAAADPPDGPLVVSPSSSRRELLELIGSAQTSLDVYAEVVQDNESIAALVAAAKRGVTVRLIVPDEQDKEIRADYFQLMDDKVAVRTIPKLYVHAKLVVADERRAFIGSQNFTATSLDQNRELGLLIDDPALIGRLDRTFETDFAAGSPFA
ncbi:MAG TPA: phospholipase D-like domain-containing protein [Thermomicrobiales bacterium]|jgi:phosphatidylserine/phosphatidylglycerophosphate/cardiolipin synthase-like enzyme